MHCPYIQSLAIHIYRAYILLISLMTEHNQDVVQGVVTSNGRGGGRGQGRGGQGRGGGRGRGRSWGCSRAEIQEEGRQVLSLSCTE